MGQQLYFDNYTPVGDIIVIAICMVMIVLVATSYVNKTKNFSLFLNMTIYLVSASMCDIIYHDWYAHITDGNYIGVYVTRVIYHALLFSILLLYIVYIVEIQHLEKHKRIPIMIAATTIYLAVIITDIVTTVKGTGFRLNKNGTAITGINIFLIGYIAFIGEIAYLMIVYRDRIYKKVMYGFYGTMIVSFVILYLQGKHGQSSFTVSTFLFPVMAMLYLVHSTSYDIESGAVNVMAMKELIKYNYDKKKEFLFMSLYMPDFESEGKVIPPDLQATIRRFASEFFKQSVLFQISNGHVILVAPKNLNPDHENRVNKILNQFQIEYLKFQFDYKVIIGKSIEEISKKNEYISFIKNIHRNMDINDVYIVGEKDVDLFNRYEYILEQLTDIYKKRDMRDERVLAYCQPVFNIKTGRYDTAEALMRLNLPDIGMVFPDQFIPVAEEHGFIHVLTEIILTKTCDAIKSLMSEGYDVNRISVNVSVMELRDEKFTSDIDDIIEASAIPNDKIAVEITESRNDSDFLLMKDRIEELKRRGIKLYLDDFGTGYSNMERIMELPFDIIKFDRSLVLASDSDERSEKMVKSLAGMFSELNYSVLYEGVENDGDEIRCINMSASYLQGYKYSKPITIADLNRFFAKSDVL
ncbi:MAG: EAL domain-containing protein [Lachnospiraceae bacterium]|nr:EAL domain-containing protein [Lachnospiraceae bacterium]